MKYLIVLSVIAAVASAGYLKPAAVAGETAEIQEIIAAINSPSTDPATAAALEQLLLDTLGIAPIQPAPVVVEESPISVGPAIVEWEHDGGALTPGLTPVETPAPAVVPAPSAVVEASDGSPLVQIILNINQASAAGVAPSPAEAPIVDTPVPVAPVIVVDEAVNVEGPSPVAVAPIVIVDPAVVAPAPIDVIAVSPPAVVPAPIDVIAVSPPVVAPAPVQTLPDILN